MESAKSTQTIDAAANAVCWTIAASHCTSPPNMNGEDAVPHSWAASLAVAQLVAALAGSSAAVKLPTISAPSHDAESDMRVCPAVRSFLWLTSDNFQSSRPAWPAWSPFEAPMRGPLSTEPRHPRITQ